MDELPRSHTGELSQPRGARGALTLGTLARREWNPRRDVLPEVAALENRPASRKLAGEHSPIRVAAGGFPVRDPDPPMSAAPAGGWPFLAHWLLSRLGPKPRPGDPHRPPVPTSRHSTFGNQLVDHGLRKPKELRGLYRCGEASRELCLCPDLGDNHPHGVIF
jgi:hypothetical protein